MSDTSDASDASTIVDYSDTKVKCTVCNVLIPNTDSNINQHRDGRNHKQMRIKQIMSDNAICEDDGESYCKLCKEYFPYITSDIEEHAFSTDHTVLIEKIENLISGEFIDFKGYLSSGRQVYNVHCDICNCNVPCALFCIKQHIEGYNHMSARSAKLRPWNGIFNTTGGDDVWCKLCDEYIPNNLQDILSHIDYDQDHNDYLNELECLIEDENISIDRFLAELHCHVADCNECDVVLPCTLQNLDEHVKGNRHNHNS